MKTVIAVLSVAFAVCLLPACESSQATATSSKKSIDKWYQKQEWLNGLSRTPDKSVNKEEFAQQYEKDKAEWDKAFAYLKETDLANLKPGRYPIDGDNVFATVSEGPTRELDKTKWEAHQKYHDIHFVISGKEQIGITTVGSVTVVQAYDPSKDIGFYSGDGKYYLSDTTNFFIVLAGDAHRPGVKADGTDNVKKVVIKIRKSEQQ